MKGSSQPSISRHYDTIKRQTGNASKCAIFAQQPGMRRRGDKLYVRGRTSGLRTEAIFCELLAHFTG
jgi:hypothetical protein